MYTYEVRFTYQGRNLTEIIKANSGGDAIFAVKSRYPGAAVYGATRL